MDKIRKLFRWETALIGILIAQILVFGLINPRFLKINVLLGSVNDYISICIIALFVTFVIITGGMDIQAGSVVGLTSIVMGILWKVGGMNIWGTIPIVLLVGALCGAFSGFLIAYTGVQAMVVTLGGMFLFSGLAVVISNAAVSSAFQGITGFPADFVQLANGKSFGIPNPFIIFIVLIIFAYLLLHKTKYGRKIFLVGVNANAAQYAGINTRLVIMSTYILSGMGAAIAGVVLTSYLGSSRADFGAELTLPIITAVVLGGTIITGGKGGVIGTALASLVIGILKFGLQMVGFSTQYLDIPVGILLIVAVAVRSISASGGFKFPTFMKTKGQRQKMAGSAK